jgi:hypothetical protein
MKMGPKTLADKLSTVWSIHDAPRLLALRKKTHLCFLRDALGKDCECSGKGRDLWEGVLREQNIPVLPYRKSLYRLFAEGGGRTLNHLYVGAPSSGKSFLCLSIAKVFPGMTFFKPESGGGSHPLSGLEKCRAIVFNDWRWPCKGISWGELLNIFNNESFRIAKPKTDRSTDHTWNADGSESVVAFLTTNVEPVFIRGGSVDTVETKAFTSRFRRFDFPLSLKNADTEAMKFGGCACCYAQWVFSSQEEDEPEAKKPRLLEPEGAPPSQ